MKHITFFAAAAILAGCAAAPEPESLVLRYDSPATYFEETFVIGNGTLGAIIYGGVGEEKIALNDLTLWSGEPEGAPFTPDAWKDLPEVRACLDAEDYPAAEKAAYKVQGHEGQYYQPLGTILFETGDKATGYGRALDISQALASVTYGTSDGRVSREYFASAPDSVIVVRLTATDSASISGTLSYSCPQKVQSMSVSVDGCSAEMVVDGYTAYDFNHDGKTTDPDYYLYDPDRGIHFETIIKATVPDGRIISFTDDSFTIENASEALLLITNVTSFNGAERDPVREGRDCKAAARSRIDAASYLSYTELKKAHTDWYAGLFGRLSLDLGETAPEIASLPTDVQLRNYTAEQQVNPDLEELYFQFGRYLLISCSGTPSVPANLQGLWNEYLIAPWRSNYTVNINLEENYWPAEVANLSEMHMPLLGFVKAMAETTGKLTAENYYNVHRGWASGHNSSIWAMTCPVGEHKALPQWSNWCMGGAWLSTHIWEHYAFTMDRDFLAEYYPVLKGAAEFCIDWLIEKDGYLMTSPSTSPEANYLTPEGFQGAVLYGGTADLAFTRECLLDARSAAETLGVDNDFISEIDATLEGLLPYRIGSRGNLQEWYHDWEDADWHHRHQSHLVGLYPGHHISVDKTPELARACAKTLEIKGDKTTGWSTGWRVNLQARLKDGEAAYHIYRMLLRYVSPDKYDGEDASRGGGTYPNLLDAHSPFQIDGNFGGCAGVLEMHVQSSLEDGVELLPAIPEAWKAQGHLSGVRVRGGYELDFSWADGKVTSLKVTSRRPDEGSLTLRCGSDSWTAKVRPGKTVRVI